MNPEGTTPKSAPRVTDDRDRALYVISIAAELSGVHPQTLRFYERRGLLSPQRTAGNNRRYSQRDIERVRLIQSLTQEQGMNLAAVEVVMRMQRELDSARDRLEALEREMNRVRRSSKTEMVLLREVQTMLEGWGRAT